MTIVFRLGGVFDQTESRQLIEDAAALLKVPNGAVEQVIVADDYSAAVKSIDAKARVTTKWSVGKTIAKKGSDGIVRGSIVYPAETIAGAIRASGGSLDRQHLQCDDQVLLYAVYHEFGHCMDYHERQVLQVANRANPGEKDMVEYYGPILLEEFAATCHAASATAQPIYASVAQYEDGRCDNEWRTKRGTSSQGKTKATWYVLVEEAKSYGLWVGNRRLQLIASPHCLQGNQAACEIIECYHQMLLKLWDAYPNWKGEPTREFVKLVDDAAYMLFGL